MPPYQGTQAVTRALQILKVFTDEKPRWELNALVQQTELNKTTVFRILSALEDDGFVHKHPNGEYTLGSELIALGGRAARANELRQISRPYMERITHETGETTTLEILRTDGQAQPYMLVIDEILGRNIVGITQYIGSRLPIHHTSTGKAITAFLSAERQAEILNTIETAASPNERNTFENDLQTIYTDGYATAKGELEAGVMAVSSPIFDTNHHPQAALSIVGPSIRIKPADLIELSQITKQATSEISYQLGYREK